MFIGKKKKKKLYRSICVKLQIRSLYLRIRKTRPVTSRISEILHWLSHRGKKTAKQREIRWRKREKAIETKNRLCVSSDRKRHWSHVTASPFGLTGIRCIDWYRCDTYLYSVSYSIALTRTNYYYKCV